MQTTKINSIPSNKQSFGRLQKPSQEAIGMLAKKLDGFPEVKADFCNTFTKVFYEQERVKDISILTECEGNNVVFRVIKNLENKLLGNFSEKNFKSNNPLSEALKAANNFAQENSNEISPTATNAISKTTPRNHLDTYKPKQEQKKPFLNEVLYAINAYKKAEATNPEKVPSKGSFYSVL